MKTWQTNTILLARMIGMLLQKRKMTLATAESCTGGLIAAAVTAVPGASAYFMGGVVSYDNRIKAGVLGVPESTLKKFGAVSAQTVAAMARGVKKLMQTNCAIAVSGIAGPGGGTREKPVGLVYIGIAVNRHCTTYTCHFNGSRKSIREKAVRESISRLIELLQE